MGIGEGSRWLCPPNSCPPEERLSMCTPATPRTHQPRIPVRMFLPFTPPSVRVESETLSGATWEHRDESRHVSPSLRASSEPKTSHDIGCQSASWILDRTRLTMPKNKGIITKLSEKYKLCPRFHSRMEKNNLHSLFEGSCVTRGRAFKMLSHHANLAEGSLEISGQFPYAFILWRRNPLLGACTKVALGKKYEKQFTRLFVVPLLVL